MPAQTRYLLATAFPGMPELTESERQSVGMILAVQDMLVSSSVSTGGGRIYKQLGHSIRAVYSSAEDCAESAARQMTQLRALPALPDGKRPAVAMALHCGPLTVAGKGFRGPALEELEVILSLAQPGQLLVSAAFAVALGDYQPFGCELTLFAEYPASEANPVPLRVYQFTSPGFAQQAT